VSLKAVKRWLHRDEQSLPEVERQRIAQALEKHSALQTVYNMRRELNVVWERSTASSEQLLKHLQDWCQRAEASGIAPLQEFSMRLRSYA
jgi:stearoyl-CoA desaturase (delta-9 desaturase)